MKLPSTCEKLRSLGLEEESIITLRLCTLFLKVGIVDLSLSFRALASLMQRNFDDSDELTWLQKKIKTCAEVVGTPCGVEEAVRGEKILVVSSEAAQSLNVDAFLQELEGVFTSNLLETCGG